MEQAKYWTWTRRKLGKRSHVDSSMTDNHDSWEEHAFAEDSAGHLGGFNWPPRSYSCSFCRREFKSAQALGGHMNVHRRDRARLKQYQDPNTQIPQDHHQHRNPLDDSLVCNPNPNSNTSGLSPSKVSAPSSASPSSSTIVQEQQKGCHFHILLSNSESKLEADNNLKAPKTGIRDHEEYLKLDSTTASLTLVSCRNRPSGPGGSDAGEGISSKRRMIDETCLPFFLKSCTDDRRHLRSEVLGLNTGSMEELDLELRLGSQPKRKSRKSR